MLPHLFVHREQASSLQQVCLGNEGCGTLVFKIRLLFNTAICLLNFREGFKISLLLENHKLTTFKDISKIRRTR